MSLDLLYPTAGCPVSLKARLLTAGAPVSFEARLAVPDSWSPSVPQGPTCNTRKLSLGARPTTHGSCSPSVPRGPTCYTQQLELQCPSRPDLLYPTAGAPVSLEVREKQGGARSNQMFSQRVLFSGAVVGNADYVLYCCKSAANSRKLLRLRGSMH